ncbi:MAG: hypothetical protein HYU80_03960 [Candidatus Blackburnbacteria bacterium]|nr:hypothetical protein [Candidatus Blackburnbacteria bacterium]
MNPKVIIESLSMDLLRAALALHRGSFSTAERFKEEALKRSAELEPFLKSDQHLQKLAANTKKALEENSEDIAEDLLMYSVRFKNLARFKFS